MKMIIFIYILGWIYSKSSPTIYDLEMSNNNYTIYQDENYYFRMKSERFTNLNLQIDIFTWKRISLNMTYKTFSHWPSDSDIYDNYLNNSFIPISHYGSKTVSNRSISFQEKNYSISSTYSDYIVIYFEINYIDNVVPDDYLLVSIFVIPYSIFHISYNKEYQLNNKNLNNKEGKYIFNLRTNNKGNGTIKLKINKEAYPDRNMVVNILRYEKSPNYLKEFENNYIEKKELLLDSKITDNTFSIYGYLFEKKENATFLSFSIYIDKNITYFSINVFQNEDDKSEDDTEKEKEGKNNSKNSFSNPSLLLIINVALAIVIIFLYCICKKCN